MIQLSSAETTNFASKSQVESVEQNQASEKDRVDSIYKQLDARFDTMQELIKSLVQSQEKPASTFVQNIGNSGRGHQHNEPMMNREYKNFSNATDLICFGCGGPGHFQNNCERIKSMVQNGMLIFNQDGKVCLPDGSRVPSVPTGASLVERVDRYYSTMRPTQAYYRTFEEMEDKMSGTIPRDNYPVSQDVDHKEQRLARLEKELDLRERESALMARQFKLESKSSDKKELCSYLLEKFDDDLTSLQEDKGGFLEYDDGGQAKTQDWKATGGKRNQQSFK